MKAFDDEPQNKETLKAAYRFVQELEVMISDPLPNRTVAEMGTILSSYMTTQELADAYAAVHNKFLWVEDNEYDYDESTDEYKKACDITDSWGELLNCFEDVIVSLERKNECGENSFDKNNILKDFMKKHSYRDGHGWWIRYEKQVSVNDG